jgi:ABC-type molybdenum transport system ATPase subunit/photorepair protein PhrA
VTAADSVDQYCGRLACERGHPGSRWFGSRHNASGCDLPPLLLPQNIVLTFGAAPLLSGAGLAVATGDRICLVGHNGSGKYAIC